MNKTNKKGLLHQYTGLCQSSKGSGDVRSHTDRSDDIFTKYYLFSHW